MLRNLEEKMCWLNIIKTRGKIKLSHTEGGGRRRVTCLERSHGSYNSYGLPLGVCDCVTP